MKGFLVLLGMRAGLALAPLFSRQASERASDLAGAVAYAFGTAQRRRLVANLSVVLGRADPDLLALRAREAFRTQAANYVDLLRMPHLQLEQIAALIDLPGWEHVEAALAGGRGAILTVGHVGNIDLVAQGACARGVPVTIPIEPIRPPALLNLVTRLRSAHGLKLVRIDRGALRIVARTLREGGLVGFAIDRDVQGSGQPTRLFGRQAHLSHAPAVLSLRTGAPIVPALTRRLPGGRFRAILGPPIMPEGTTADVMRRVAARLEDAIRDAPGQWVMFERLFNEEPVPRSG